MRVRQRGGPDEAAQWECVDESGGVRGRGGVPDGGGELPAERVRPVRHVRQRAGVGGGLLERELRGGAVGRCGVGVGGLREARFARRLLERGSEVPPRRVPRQVRLRLPPRLQRVPCGPDAHPLSLYVLTSFGGSKGSLPPLVDCRGMVIERVLALAGNMHRELGDHAAARRPYRQAAAVADAPHAIEMARAYAALASFELGELCEAQRTFRSLVPRPGEEVSDWLREPWEAFSRAMANAELSADGIACALDETASDRTLGICPRVDLRIEFDYDGADIRADSRARWAR